jgi:hypothetical protein
MGIWRDPWLRIRNWDHGIRIRDKQEGFFSDEQELEMMEFIHETFIAAIRLFGDSDSREMSIRLHGYIGLNEKSRSSMSWKKFIVI